MDSFLFEITKDLNDDEESSRRDNVRNIKKKIYSSSFIREMKIVEKYFCGESKWLFNTNI